MALRRSLRCSLNALAIARASKSARGCAARAVSTLAPPSDRSSLYKAVEKLYEVTETEKVVDEETGYCQHTCCFHKALAELCATRLFVPLHADASGNKSVFGHPDGHGGTVMQSFTSHEALDEHFASSIGLKPEEIAGLEVVEVGGAALALNISRFMEGQDDVRLLVDWHDTAHRLSLTSKQVCDGLLETAEDHITIERLRRLVEGSLTPDTPGGQWREVVRSVLSHKQVLLSSTLSAVDTGALVAVDWPGADVPGKLAVPVFRAADPAQEFHYFHAGPMLRSQPQGAQGRIMTGPVEGHLFWRAVFAEQTARVVMNPPSFATADGMPFEEDYTTLLSTFPGSGDDAIVVTMTDSSSDWLREAEARGIFEELAQEHEASK